MSGQDFEREQVVPEVRDWAKMPSDEGRLRLTLERLRGSVRLTMSCRLSKVNGGPDKAKVRAFFESDAYLRENPLIPVRAQLVAALLEGVRGGRILDLGCGDGAVSRQLLTTDNRLTLVDFSPAMLERARAATPAGALVEFIAADVLSYAPATRFDAVLCIGVLAHLPEIGPMIERVAQLTKPGGVCVFQITDDSRPLGWALTRYGRLRERRPAYSLNLLTLSDVIATADRQNLTLRDTRRYALCMPGTGRLPFPKRLGLEMTLARSPLLSRVGAEALISFDRRGGVDSDDARRRTRQGVPLRFE